LVAGGKPMSPLWAGILIFWVPLAALVGHGYALMRRHIEWLQSELRTLGGQDWWAVRCSHCGKRMREAPSTRLSTRFEEGGRSWERTDGIFHTDRVECARAAEAMEGPR
jgi:hypothetical protein